MPIGEPASIGRKTSEWKLNTNEDVSTVQDTYETVYSFTGAGKISAISINATLKAEFFKCIIEITVDGETLYEIDMGVHFVGPGVIGLWGIPDPHTANQAELLSIIIGAEFKTSILIRAKNDTDTNPLGVSISSAQDV